MISAQAAIIVSEAAYLAAVSVWPKHALPEAEIVLGLLRTNILHWQKEINSSNDDTFKIRTAYKSLPALPNLAAEEQQSSTHEDFLSCFTMQWNENVVDEIQAKCHGFRDIYAIPASNNVDSPFKVTKND